MFRLKNRFKSLYYNFISANKVAELEGVKFGKNPYFRTKQFGSEPYLIEVGNDFKTAGNVQFITHDGGVHVIRNLYKNYEQIDSFEKIKIGNNVFIGYGAIILPGTIIEDNVIVGAGSIVRGLLEKDSIYAGVPVKKISTIEDYINKNEHKFFNTKKYNAKEKKLFLIRELK
jgi:acetyltransferase-like isoleucine patch superfamily enzyme